MPSAIRGDLRQPGGGDVRAPIEELHETQLRQGAERSKTRGLERLDEDQVGATLLAVRRQHVEHALLEREADRPEVSRVFRLGVDADAAAGRGGAPVGQLDDLVERRDDELAVVGVRAKREPFPGAERLQLRQREVLGEPAGDAGAVDGLRRLAVGKLLGHVGRGADLVLVPRNQRAILRGDDVGLDHVGAHVDRQRIRLEGVLRPMAAGAAVRDDQNPGRSGGDERRSARENRQNPHRHCHHSSLTPSWNWRGS